MRGVRGLKAAIAAGAVVLAVVLAAGPGLPPLPESGLAPAMRVGGDIAPDTSAADPVPRDTDRTGAGSGGGVAAAAPGGVAAAAPAAPAAEAPAEAAGRATQGSGGAEPATPLGDPSAPVLLVPGWSDGPEELAPLRERFLAAGWEDSTVLALAFDDPVGGNREHARAIDSAVTRLLARTGADRVDVVAHSMGGLALRYFLQSGGADRVRRVVFLATPHRGTYSAYFAWGEGSEEMQPGSPFLTSLEAWSALPGEVQGITIRTPMDLHVVPKEHALLPPLPDREVCCPTHAGLLDDAETFRVLAGFLLGAAVDGA